ncbi:hybrid sensor histidine kinase/response regulator [Mangrovicoccus ximenensis]|uniref:hybrid sensor histidine kinase/response regulator n=1 Tax=Mangrovicoccus ximenensis TaxID=1911570 RepID=UPI000D37EA4E|nr:response regulator [Mangrovicoccus ximenensis]
MTKEQSPSLQELLAAERRARLAAEQLLETKHAELTRANRRLGLHARQLTDEIIQQRRQVREVRTEAEALKGQASQAQKDLERAHRQATVAERRLWDALETIQDGFAVFNRRDQLLIANRSYLSLFDGLDGIRPGITYGELLQLLLNEGVVDTGTEAAGAWHDAMLARWTGETIEPVVLRLWNDTYVKLMDRRGQDGDLVSLVLDITDTIRYERDIEDARQRAEAAARAKAAFLANMSHEIRTPMNGVVGMSELLIESDLDEEQRLYAETIKNSAEALLVIINDVLDYSKIEAEKLVLHPEPFDLERAIHEILVLLQSSAADKGIDLLVDYDMFLPTRFVADPGRIRQILTNLIGNAVKFTPAGHVLVRVTGYAEEGSPRFNLHVTVEDTGIGIAADKLELIFGEFSQVEDERNRQFEGTGLGLAITQQLVGMMGGEIWVDSVPGEGSCFGFQLSIDAVEPPLPQDFSLPERLRSAMVVDDLPINRMILEKQLSAMGLRVATYRSAGAALNDDPGRFDLVLFDNDMPEMDGLAFAERMRAKGSGSALILMTANPSHLAAQEQESRAIFAVVQKPLLRRDLHMKLRELAAAMQAAAAVAVLPPRQRMRILAAEDNKTNQLVFSKMLKQLDLDITFANDGIEAVEKFQSTRPHLVFMDISMPRMDGKEATRKIRGIEQAEGLERTPICALTAHAMDGDDQGILEAGLDFYLTKPLRRPEILERIRAHLPEGIEIEPTEPPLPAAVPAPRPAAAAAQPPPGDRAPHP